MKNIHFSVIISFLYLSHILRLKGDVGRIQQKAMQPNVFNIQDVTLSIHKTSFSYNAVTMLTFLDLNSLNGKITFDWKIHTCYLNFRQIFCADMQMLFIQSLHSKHIPVFHILFCDHVCAYTCSTYASLPGDTSECHNFYCLKCSQN